MALRRAAARRQCGELEVGGTQREHGQGIGAKRVGDRLDLGHAFRPEHEVGPRPGSRSSASRRRATRCARSIIVVLIANRLLVAAFGVIEARAAMRKTSTPVIERAGPGLGAWLEKPG